MLNRIYYQVTLLGKYQIVGEFIIYLIQKAIRFVFIGLAAIAMLVFFTQLVPGKNLPFWTQFFNSLKFDFGISSCYAPLPVSEVIAEGLATSLPIIGASIALAVIISWLIAKYTVEKKLTAYIILFLMILFSSAPAFGLADFFRSILMTEWLGTLIDYFHHRDLYNQILAVFALAVGNCLVIELFRNFRSIREKTMGKQYSRALVALGMNHERGSYKNRALLYITIILSKFPIIIGTAVVVEQALDIGQGIGFMAYQAAQFRDFYLISGVAIVVVVIVSINNFILSIINKLVDRRIDQV